MDDEDQMGLDFVRRLQRILRVHLFIIVRCDQQMNFLANLVKVFPSLKTRPLHLTGESYCGTYIVSLKLCLAVRADGCLVNSHTLPRLTLG